MFVLCILDGWGVRPQASHNGILNANTPNYDRFLSIYPHTTLEASEHYVGLPDEQMGNSEVGHMNIGAGRVVMQDLPRIDDALKNDKIRALPSYQKLKATKGDIHLMGLLSDGGVHSHIDHILGIAELLKNDGKTVYLHAFLDGRDTPPKSAQKFIQKVLDAGLKIASLGGRYYGMDRDQRWDRIDKAMGALLGQGERFDSPLTYIQEQYDQGITDEFMIPAIAEDFKGIQENDAIFMVNFRADRVRQILKILLEHKFNIFGLTEYSKELTPHITTFFSSDTLDHPLGEVISNAGLKQLRLAETEKYAHVTFFFNGGREEVFEGEDRILVPSPKVATYDLQPEMSAWEVCEKLCNAIESGEYGLIVVNFANADMVGHTGIEPAIVKAIETLDEILGKVEEVILSKGGKMLLTADHGNAEETYDEIHHQPHTSHTLNPVPLILVGGTHESLKTGKLCDIAPTLLKLMNIEIPKEITGEVLVA